MRENVSSYSLTSLIKSKKQEDIPQSHHSPIFSAAFLRSWWCTQSVLILLLVLVHLPATQSSSPMGLKTLEIAKVKNPNKNPVTECAIEELDLELVNLPLREDLCLTSLSHRICTLFQAKSSRTFQGLSRTLL